MGIIPELMSADDEKHFQNKRSSSPVPKSLSPFSTFAKNKTFSIYADVLPLCPLPSFRGGGSAQKNFPAFLPIGKQKLILFILFFSPLYLHSSEQASFIILVAHSVTFTDTNYLINCTRR